MSKDGAALGAFSVEDAQRAYDAARDAAMVRLRQTLYPLRTHPHQVLLFEGGTEQQRQALALWWAAALHCEAPTPTDPCYACTACLHIGARVHRDVLAYDGRISNKEDEENPGFVRALSVENARALKATLGDSTQGGKRVVLLAGLDVSRISSANALLKVLEEPSSNTVFVLLAPQREQLLPTLVSRSWVITLPWPAQQKTATDMIPWETALHEFLQHGRGWWSLTSTKGAVDQEKAEGVVLLCQRALAQAIATRAGNRQEHTSPLHQVFAPCSALQKVYIGHLLEEAHEALQYNVNPARVLDWMAVQLFTCVHGA